MSYQLRTLKKIYKEAIEKEDYNIIDFLVTQRFWQIRKVRKAFEKYAENWRNPNIYDTCCYKYLKPSEQALFESTFMNEVLLDIRDI